MDGRIEKGLVSVIIPTYNSGAYIAEALDSVLRQTYRDFEVIVVDDGSIDDTKEIVHRYDKSLVQLYSIEHKGVSHARNFGVHHARGEFIAFLDSDDIWFEDKLGRQIPIFTDLDVGLVCADMEFFGNKNSYRTFLEMVGSHRRGLIDLIRGNYIGTSSVVLRRRIFDEVRGFPEGVAIGEDYRLWLSVALRSKIVCLNELLVRYRIHLQQSSLGRAKNYRALIHLYGELSWDPGFGLYRYIVLGKYLEYCVKYIIALLLHL